MCISSSRKQVWKHKEKSTGCPSYTIHIVDPGQSPSDHIAHHIATLTAHPTAHRGQLAYLNTPRVAPSTLPATFFVLPQFAIQPTLAVDPSLSLKATIMPNSSPSHTLQLDLDVTSFFAASILPTPHIPQLAHFAVEAAPSFSHAAQGDGASSEPRFSHV